MKKLFTVISSILSVVAVSGAVSQLPAFTAHAQDATPPTIQQSLVLPNSYEQYLPLVEPSSTAVSVNYTAIADGNTIYLFDRKANTYKKYEHTQNAEEKRNPITKIEFSENGELYFLDVATNLYKLSPQTLTVEYANFSCSSFSLYGESIYFLTISDGHSQISTTALKDLNDPKSYKTVAENLGANPTFTLLDGKLYYIKSDNFLYEYGIEKNRYEFSFNVADISLSGNLLLCIDKSGAFRAYDYLSLIDSEKGATIEPIFKDEAGETDKYKSLSVFGEHIYAIKGNVVKQFSVKDVAFTDFEIGANSKSAHRLSGATELCLTGNRLYIADENNQRVGVFDTHSKTHLDPILLPETFAEIDYLSVSQETLLIANAETALLYDLENTAEPLTTFQEFSGKLVGVSCVSETHYLITSDGGFHFVKETTDEERKTTAFTLSSTVKKQSAAIPQALRLLTSDVYGNLYVGAGTELYRFTEAEFISETSGGEKLLSELPVSATKLAVDYKKTVYALCENKILRFDENKTAFDLAKSLVYSQTAQTPVNSFAFGVEENAAYLLYNGNFLIQTDELNLPTVKNIPVNKADESIFAKKEAVFSVVNVSEKTLIVEFDGARLQGATAFPYLSHSLTAKPLTALQIGEAGEYTVLALLNETTKEYQTFLALSSACEKLDETEYLTAYETAKKGYLSNAVKLYKFPYLTELLTVSALSKGAEVSILGEVKFDYEYYRVSIKTDESELTGYIPKSYVNEFNGAPKTPQNKVIGNENTDDAVARLIFIVLGLAAIGILIDFLLLRKKSDDESDEE